MERIDYPESLVSGRVIIFYLTLPQPVAIPPETIFTEHLDIQVPELVGLPMHLTPQHAPLPAEAQGRLLVSLRFWPTMRRTLSDVSLLDVPSDVFRSTLPRDALASLPRLGRVRRLLQRALEGWRATREPVTVVEAVTLLLQSDDMVSDAFDRCAVALNDVVRAYRLATRTPLRLPSMERLPPVVPYFTRRPDVPFDWDGPLLFHLHYNLPFEIEPEIEDVPDLMARIESTFTALKRGNPLIAYSEHELEARRSLNAEGDFAQAVTHTQLALEALFDNLLTLMCWEEQRSPTAVAASEFSDIPLARRVQRNFPARLGGNWDPKGAGPIGQWRGELTPLRNRVIHSAYNPSRQETKRAFDIANAVSRFVFERLVLDQDHPRTALFSVGLEGFEKYGSGVTDELRALASSDDGEWLESYASWREAFERELDRLRR